MDKYQTERDYQLALLNSNKVIESIQAKLAMQAVALTHANRQPHPFGHLEMFEKALSATQADVDAFMAKKKTEWEKEVYSVIESLGSDYTSQRLKDIMWNGGVVPKFTHKKKTYLAQCMQWTYNYDQVMQLLNDAGVEVTPYEDYLVLRYNATDRDKPYTKIDTFKKGMWIRVGENGAVKIMKDEEFQLKYEAI